MCIRVLLLQKHHLSYYIVHFALLQCTVSIMLVHNNDIEHDGADKMSYVFDYCYEDKKGVSFVYVVQYRRKD